MIMHRTDNSVYLLYIEPPKGEKLEIPLEDSWTALMRGAFMRSEGGTSEYDNTFDTTGRTFRTGGGYKGEHYTACNKKSTNNDYRLENGMITNSLCVFYLQYYRESIPESEWNKLRKLKKFYDGRVSDNFGKPVDHIPWGTVDTVVESFAAHEIRQEEQLKDEKIIEEDNA